MYAKARRRLAQWVDEQGVTRYGIRIKPFWLKKGTYAYYSGEPKDEEKYVEATIRSATVLTANTIAALAIDVPSTLAVFVLGIITDFFLGQLNWWRFAYGQEPGNLNMTWLERIKGLFTFRDEAHGFSGIYNVLGGYLAYNAIFDKDARKLWLPLVGASGTMLGNLFVLAKEKKGLEHTNHYAHFGGFAYGTLYAWLINRFWRKKTHGVGFLRRHDGKLTLLLLGVLIFQFFTMKAGKKRLKEQLEEQKKEEGTEMVEMLRCDEKCESEHSAAASRVKSSSISTSSEGTSTLTGATHSTATTASNMRIFKQASQLGIKPWAVDVRNPSLLTGTSRSEPSNAPAWGSEYYHTEPTESSIKPWDRRYY